MFESVSSAIVAVQSKTADRTSGYAEGQRVSASLASTQDFNVVKRVVVLWVSCVSSVSSEGHVWEAVEESVEKERKRAGSEERLFQHWVRSVNERGWVVW